MRSRFVFMLAMVLLMPPAWAADDYASLFAEIERANQAGSGKIALDADITLSGALPAITGEISIDGNGHSISGGKQYRIFDVAGGSLTILNVTLRDGRAPEKEGGGAIRIRDGSALNVKESVFSDNMADLGGAIATEGETIHLRVANSSFAGNSAESHGGALFISGGIVDISGSGFQRNEAKFTGGGVHALAGIVSATNSSFYRNAAAQGGAITVSGASAILTHLTLVDNTAHVDGDSLYKREGKLELRNSVIQGPFGSQCEGGLDHSIGNFGVDLTCGEDARGDAMLAGISGRPVAFPLKDGSPALNTADPRFCLATDQLGTLRPYGGACDIGAIESTTAQPAPDSKEPPPPCSLADQIAAANTDAEVAGCPAGDGADVIRLVQDVTLREPLPHITSEIVIDGGGHSISARRRFRIFDVNGGKLTIRNLILTRGRASRNDNGGAIRVRNGGALDVENSSFIKNQSDNQGGAIMMERYSQSLSISDSSFISNSALSGGAINSYLDGYKSMTIERSSFVNNRGGALVAGNPASVRITNSTFSTNQHERSGNALWFSGGARVTIAHATIVMDSPAPQDEGAIVRGSGNGAGWLRLRNSVIAGGNNRHCPARLTENIGNLFADGSCSPRASGDPLLADLSGLTEYYALHSGSPAIDAADPRFCPPTDQIGAPRPQGRGCDIGAIEMPAPPNEEPPASVANPQLSNCIVTTTHPLNFRDGPNGNRIGGVPPQTTLVASAREPGWFQVEYNGETGWISADYVISEGDCG